MVRAMVALAQNEMEPTVNNELLRMPAVSIPVKSRYDVAVVGGGIAGVSAALAAARAGVKVCLVEKQIALGGLATLGIVTVWLPICDGKGRQVIGGIGEELLRLSVAGMKSENKEAGFAYFPKCWEKGGKREERAKNRFLACFNPGSYMLSLEELLVKEGVDIFYDTRLSDVKRKRNAITHLVLENKSGRFAIGVGCAVDASGDADLCFMAGEETETSNANVASGWFYYLKDGKAHLSPTSNAYSSRLDPAELKVASYDGTNGDDVTRQVLEAHSLIRRDTAALAQKFPDSAIEPFCLPTIPCFRATRRLVGAKSMTEGDMHKWFDDTVALTGDWRRPGPVFAITLDMLRGVANSNLLAAGRCYSMDKSVWDLGRVIPTCAVTGEAAGLAAAMAVKTKRSMASRLSPRTLRAAMARNGNFASRKLVEKI